MIDDSEKISLALSVRKMPAVRMVIGLLRPTIDVSALFGVDE